MERSASWARFTVCLLLAAVGAKASLTEPPKQHEPWAAPSGHGIPDYVIKAAATLFDAGLADPRGGAYREAELPVPRDGQDTLHTHAWVFSSEYAVCWNGLVYRIRSAGAPADLDQDVRTIVAAGPWSSGQPVRFGEDPGWAKAAFWSGLELGQTMVPASIALLLRLGRPDLAAQLWQAPKGSRTFGLVLERGADEGQWLSTAARAWLGTAYWRLVQAFERGDDQDAVDVAESLLRWESRVRTTWREPNVRVPARIPDISFLDPVSALLADSQRRLREPAHQFVDFDAVRKGENDPSGFLRRPQDVRIANLIDRLEDVRGGKDLFPGPLLFSFDPIFELLAKEGEAAVDSLLDAYEDDRRLTRTFDYSRPWSTNYTPVPVRRVVEILLGDILGDPNWIHNSTPAELRAWWRQHKSLDRAGRSFELLADDKAGPERWLESANFLTMRSDLHWANGNTVTRTEACDPKKAVPPVYGEGLRERQEPSMSELLAKRTAILVASNSNLACRMAVDAALWDSRTALPVLRTAATLKSCRADHRVAAARLSVGDAGGAADWAAELRNRATSPSLGIEELAPLWMFPDDPVMQQTAEWLFTRPESPLSPALKHEFVNSALLKVPAFRRAVASALGDARVVGKATRSADGVLSFTTTSGWGGLSMEPGHDPRQAPAGQERPIRLKDLVAWELRSLDGAPEFELDWPETDKDAIISELAEFLKAHEDDLRAFPAQLQDTNCPGERVYLNQ